ncbi:MAG TPA: right-handed parallel beta-helix repeat-containing protein [Allosphingosinicella sp.]
MNYIRTCLLAAACLVVSTPAFGQATRTWVSGSSGNDANPCSRTAPCQTFAGAYNKTAAGGEINVIDAGGFGAVTIAKNITIDGLGPMSSILAVNFNGITVNGPGIVVNLRNLTINGGNGTIGSGIRIVDAAAVNIDNVVIENFAGTGTNGRGVAIETAAANVRVNIQDVRFANLTNFGVHSNPTAGNVILAIDDATFVRGGTTAIQLRQLTNATIDETTVTGHNPGAAVALELGTVNAHISNSVFTDNAFGVFAGNGGAPVARITGTTITRSATAALSLSGGTIVSYGDNPIRGNTGNELPSAVELPR